MGANSLAGANLAGSLVQPSYLSLPVGVGSGQAGYLQIPMGNPAGRASYLQIPVNTGYGPSPDLQIELGRHPASAGPAAPVQGPTPRPLGSVPEVGVPTASRSAGDIFKTSIADLPPVVPAVEYSSARHVADFGADDARAKSPAAIQSPTPGGGAT